MDDPNTDLIYDLNDEGTYALLVQAFAADTGAVSYTWKYQELSPENSIENMPIKIVSDSQVSNVYVQVNPEDMQKEYRYYWGDNHILYTGTIPPTEDELTTYGTEFYIKQSQCIADKAGVYWAIAENRITNSATSEESERAKFLRPEAVVISTQPKNGLLTEDATGEKVYKLNVVADNADGILTYQWQKSADYTSSFDPEAAKFADIEGATLEEYEADEQGRYRVVVTNTRNKETSILASDSCRVTNTASMPVIENDSPKIFSANALTAVNCPTIVLDSSVDSDEYVVEWYVYESLKEGKIKEESLAPGMYESKLNPVEAYDEIVAITGGEDIIAKYYAIITNKFNGSEISTEKPEEGDMFEVRATAEDTED